MTIEQKLDEILMYFKEKGHYNIEYDKNNIIWGELANRVSNGNNKFFLMLLNKLEEDGYTESKSFSYPVITVNGLVF